MLRIVAGLDSEFSGSIQPIGQNRISYIFQEPCLIQWKNVRKNMRYALSGHVDEKMLLDYSKILGLTDYLNYYPSQLSGGLLQRVNLLRGFLYPATLLLMDEPFKSLDIKNKEAAMDLMVKIQKERNLTVVLVTHSLEEAIQLGDYIYIVPHKPKGSLECFANPRDSIHEKSSTESKIELFNTLKEILNTGH